MTCVGKKGATSAIDIEGSRSRARRVLDEDTR